jgi:hypothetical protein
LSTWRCCRCPTARSSCRTMAGWPCLGCTSTASAFAQLR